VLETLHRHLHHREITAVGAGLAVLHQAVAVVLEVQVKTLLAIIKVVQVEVD
jgi:hypothetical protein